MKRKHTFEESRQESYLNNYSDTILDEETGLFKKPDDFINESSLEYKQKSPKPGTSSSKITILGNEDFKEYLKKIQPISPKRKGKRQVERLPFALTSDNFVQIIKTKNQKK